MTTCDVAPCEEDAVMLYVLEDGQETRRTYRCSDHAEETFQAKVINQKVV